MTFANGQVKWYGAIEEWQCGSSQSASAHPWGGSFCSEQSWQTASSGYR